MLRRMQSRARWGTAFRALYWFLIIGFSIGAFYFVQPYYSTIMGNINELQNNLETLKAFVN